jgi:hypothetical protein
VRRVDGDVEVADVGGVCGDTGAIGLDVHDPWSQASVTEVVTLVAEEATVT